MSDMDLPSTAGAELVQADDNHLPNSDFLLGQNLDSSVFDFTSYPMASQDPVHDDSWYANTESGANNDTEGQIERLLSAVGPAPNANSFNVAHQSNGTMNFYHSNASPDIKVPHKVDSASDSPPSTVMSPEIYNHDDPSNFLGSTFEQSYFYESDTTYQQTTLASSTDPAQPHPKASFGLQTPSPTKSPASARSIDEEFYERTRTVVIEGSGQKVVLTNREIKEQCPKLRERIDADLKKWRVKKVEKIPYLKKLPNCKGQGVCADSKCSRIVKFNGDNDREHCTRCFKRINGEREFENGMRITMAERGIYSERGLDEPTNFLKKNAKRSAVPTPINQPVDAGADALAANPLYHLTEGSINNHHNVVEHGFDAHYRTAAVQHGFEDAHDDAIGTGLGTRIKKGLPNTSIRFKTIQEARDHLANPTDLQPINFENDDWQRVKDEQFYNLVEELVSVLPSPGSTPSGLDAQQREDYERKHADRLAIVRKKMSNPRHLENAEACAVLLMGHVLKIHEVGIPQAAYDRFSDKATRSGGYKPELEFTCSARARKVIELASSSKYIALDIVEGKNLADLALAPTDYLRKKVSNAKTNGRREGRQGKPEKAKGRKKADKSEEANDPDDVWPSAANGLPYFNEAQAPPRGYQAYMAANSAFNVHSSVPTPLYNTFVDSSDAVAGAGGKRKRTIAPKDEMATPGSKRSKFGGHGVYGEGLGFD